MILAALHHHHHAAAICDVLWIVAVIATVIAVVLAVAALLGRPVAPWVPVAVLAAIGWLLLLFLC